jgi:hypothetical protein
MIWLFFNSYLLAFGFGSKRSFSSSENIVNRVELFALTENSFLLFCFSPLRTFAVTAYVFNKTELLSFFATTPGVFICSKLSSPIFLEQNIVGLRVVEKFDKTIQTFMIDAIAHNTKFVAGGCYKLFHEGVFGYVADQKFKKQGPKKVMQKVQPGLIQHLRGGNFFKDKYFWFIQFNDY